MSEYNALLKLRNRSKNLVLTSIVLVVLAIIFFIVSTVLATQAVTGSFGYPTGAEPSSAIAATAVMVIGILLILGYAIYCFVMSIMIIVSSASLNTSANKTLYLVMAILGIFGLGLISYIVIWVVASGELKNGNSYDTPNSTQVPPSASSTTSPAY